MGSDLGPLALPRSRAGVLCVGYLPVLSKSPAVSSTETIVSQAQSVAYTVPSLTTLQLPYGSSVHTHASVKVSGTGSAAQYHSLEVMP